MATQPKLLIKEFGLLQIFLLLHLDFFYLGSCFCSRPNLSLCAL